MKEPNRWCMIFAILILMVVTPGITDASDKTNTGPDIPEWFLTVQAESATASKKTLQFNGLPHDVMFMTESPVRDIKKVSSTRLAALWDSFGFETNPPNASLIGLTPDDGKPYEGFIVITGISAEDDGSLIFEYELIEGSDPVPVTLDNPGAFIDTFECECPTQGCENCR
ncbi:MAG: hypothetical protein GY780_00905 [bacterium]|nr:hypothetical protein [bacterium]